MQQGGHNEEKMWVRGLMKYTVFSDLLKNDLIAARGNFMLILCCLYLFWAVLKTGWCSTTK